LCQPVPTLWPTSSGTAQGLTFNICFCTWSGLLISVLWFACAQITTLVSYLSHSQVWALQQGSTLHVGSRTNRATVSFGQEMELILDAMPERPPDAPALTDAASS